MTKAKRNYGSATFWVIIVVFGICIFLSGYISANLSANGFITKESSLNIFNALLDVDIALIAFFGLILVFHLNYINSTKDRIAREKHETNIERDRFRLQHLMKSDSISSVQEVFSEIDTRYANRIDILGKQFRSLVLQIMGVAVTSVFTIGFLFLDILLNTFYIGAVTSEGLPFMNLFWSLLVLLLTLYTIITSLIFTYPKSEREIISQELKEKWKELRMQSKEEWQKRRRTRQLEQS